MATSPPIDHVGTPGDHDASPTFLTVDECAELLRVDRKTVYTAIRDGRLPALRLGRLFRIARSDIDRLRDPGTVDAKPTLSRHIRLRPVTGSFGRLARNRSGDGRV